MYSNFLNIQKSKNFKQMKKLIYLIVLLNILSLPIVKAEIALPAIVSSNMVLQRNTVVNVWGWANAQEKITIKTSWLKGAISTVAGEDGTWSVELKTTNSKAPQWIQLKSKKSDINLENILFGEVWLCSGQSNMEQPVGGFTGQPTFGSAQAIATANNPNLRLFAVEKELSTVPLKDVKRYRAWQDATPESTRKFSAVAYFYGQQLQEILNVPVGLIFTSWGGSPVQAWMSKEQINAVQEEKLGEIKLKTPRSHQTPTVLFNAMIKPLIPYTIKGAIWYQGESNRLEPETYKILFPAMVKEWRTRWGVGDFPFYYVQIAPYIYGGNKKYQTSENSAFIREVQLQCLDIIPNSGMAVTMDIGDDYCIHPPKKKEVADRLLYNALSKTYGITAVDGASPVYLSHEPKDGGLLLKFKNAETGLFAYEKLVGFEIAGEDKVFYPANARVVSRKDVLVKSDKVTNPVAVRYAWQNWIVGTLYDINLLPAPSFRTDDWNNAVRAEE
ncbi:sialate O-acetylesterase [Puteibacter caeruleilacunae]|nr:sialate O-acetylesterase [Puteibacter caeruleilacunae]